MRRSSFGRFVPLADICSATNCSLLDHLVGASEQRWRHRDAESLGCDQIDDQFELGWLLDGEIGRLRSAQNLVNVDGGAPPKVWEACPIGHEAARFDVLAKAVHGR